MYEEAENRPGCDPEFAASSSAAPQPALLACGICGKKFGVSESPHRPFCSLRCQQVDLGRWMNESYGLPWEDTSVPESETGLIDDDPDFA